jgi:hypothetical protein
MRENASVGRPGLQPLHRQAAVSHRSRKDATMRCSVSFFLPLNWSPRALRLGVEMVGAREWDSRWRTAAGWDVGGAPEPCVRFPPSAAAPAAAGADSCRLRTWLPARKACHSSRLRPHSCAALSAVKKIAGGRQETQRWQRASQQENTELAATARGRAPLPHCVRQPVAACVAGLPGWRAPPGSLSA